MLSILQLNSPIEQTKPLLQLQKASLSGWTGSSTFVPMTFSLQVCRLSSLNCCWDHQLSWDGFKGQTEKQKRWWCWWWWGSFSVLHIGLYSLRLIICSLVENNNFMRWVNHTFSSSKISPQKRARCLSLDVVKITKKQLAKRGHLSQWKKIHAMPTAPKTNAGKQGLKCCITVKDTSE